MEGLTRTMRAITVGRKDLPQLWLRVIYVVKEVIYRIWEKDIRIRIRKQENGDQQKDNNSIRTISRNATESLIL